LESEHWSPVLIYVCYSSSAEWSAAVTHHSQSGCQMRNHQSMLLELKYKNSINRVSLYAPAIWSTSDLSLWLRCYRSQTRDSIPSNIGYFEILAFNLEINHDQLNEN
jgi:hypothetical protein